MRYLLPTMVLSLLNVHSAFDYEFPFKNIFNYMAFIFYGHISLGVISKELFEFIFRCTCIFVL